MGDIIEKIKNFFHLSKKEKPIRLFANKEDEWAYRQHCSNIANAFTLGRLIVGPIGLIICNILFSNGIIDAIPVAIYAVVFLLSDVVDGQIAKRNHAKTIKGRLLDQASDKVFGASLLLFIAQVNPLAYPLLFLEFAIMGINFLKPNENAESTQIGRKKMWFLGGAIISSILGMSFEIFKDNLEILNTSLINITSVIAMIFQGLTFSSYIKGPKEEKDTIKDLEKDLELEELFSNDPELLQFRRNKRGYLSWYKTILLEIKHHKTLGDVRFCYNIDANDSTNNMKLIKAMKKYEKSNIDKNTV